MSFISYAQHGEDVILWRALGDRKNVMYVDVGAFDPTEDSVTRALYERGWRGVNIEAQAERARAFDEARPEDVNLAVAIGDRDGSVTLALPGSPGRPGWATTREPEEGFGDGAEAVHVTVPLRSLATLLPELGIDHVDVLKIDVEGAEASVVRGLLQGRVRPVVCVVEGVSPGFGRAAGDEAVSLLVDAGYTHCMFDGLNHYLTDDPTLVGSLSVPANPLDDFLYFRLAGFMEEAERLRASLSSLADDEDAPIQVRQERRRETLLRLLAAGSGSVGAGPVRQLDPATLEESAPAVAVTALYRAILGREPDAAGLAAWTERVANGLPLIRVARRLARSEEALTLPDSKRAQGRRLIRRWRAFHNLVELGALDATRETYGAGRVAPEIFVGALYTVAIGRAPSTEEMATEVAALEGGRGREVTLRAFARRPAVRRRIRKRRRSLAGGRRRPRYLDDLHVWVAEEEVRRVAGLAAAYAGRPARRHGER